MSLIANRWTGPHVLEDMSGPDVLCEGIGSITIEAGFYDDPATGESWLIEQTRTVTSHAGRVLRRDIERWVYEVAGGPPLEHHRETWGCVYLPRVNPGRAYFKLEEETTRFYPWTGFARGANLSRKRELSGYVIYDLKPAPAILTAEAISRLEERGYSAEAVAGMPLHRVIDSARMWSEAIDGGEVVDDSATPQLAMWVSPVETEVDLVYTEPDKWTTYTIRKSHIRPGPPDVDGPRFQRVESWQYTLPVPIDPPVVEATAQTADIRVEVRGGGATITSTIGDDVRVPPERYRVQRRATSGPDRDPSDDPFGMYDTDPAGWWPDTSERLWQDTSVEDISGNPTDPLPAQTAYTEPGDVTEPEPMVEDWAEVAELVNLGEWWQEGYATWVDTDVISGTSYEYRAVAMIGEDSSAPGPVARVDFHGTTSGAGFTSRVRRAEDGSVEVDVLAPEDTGLLPLEYGETLVFDPVPVDLVDLVDMTDPDGDYYEDLVDTLEELAQAVVARDRKEGLQARLELGFPLLVLERGQEIVVGAVEWLTTGNSLQIGSETVPDAWVLDGFRLALSRGSDGQLSDVDMTLDLVEQ